MTIKDGLNESQYINEMKGDKHGLSRGVPSKTQGSQSPHQAYIFDK